MKTLFGLVLLCALSVGCGNSNNSGAAIQSILNGQTLATANSYWGTAIDGYQVAIVLTADGAFQTNVAENAIGFPTSVCTGTVTYPSSTTLRLGGSCSGATQQGVGYMYIETMGSLSGSTNAGNFAAQSMTVSMNQDSNFNACTPNGCNFNLEPDHLCGPSGC